MEYESINVIFYASHMNLSHLLACIAIAYSTVIDLKTLREMTGAVIFLKTKCGHLTTQKSINRIQEEAILTAICEGKYSKLRTRKTKKFCGLKCNALQNVTNKQNELFVNFCLREAEVKNTIDKFKSNPNIFALLKKDLTEQLFESCTLSNLRVSPEAYSQIQSIFSTTGDYQDLRKYYNYACRYKGEVIEQGAMKTLKFIAKTLKDFYSYSNRFTDVAITIHNKLGDKNDTKAINTKLKYYTGAIDLLESSLEYITDKVQFHDCNSNFRDDYKKCIDQIFDAADQLQGQSKKLSVCINMRAVFDLWNIFENILVHLNHFRNISRGNYIKYTYNPYTRAPHKFCINEVSFSEFPICKNITSFSKINTNNKPLVQKQREWFDHMHYMYQLSRPASFEEYREICSTFIDRLFTHENEYTKDLTFILLSVLYRRNIISAGNLSK